MPPRPRLVLRLSFVGRKELSDPEQRIAADSLNHLMQTLAKRIQSSSTLDPTTNPGTWSHEVLNLTERIATGFVQEVAERFLLYAKEVSEPG